MPEKFNRNFSFDRSGRPNRGGNNGNNRGDRAGHRDKSWGNRGKPSGSGFKPKFNQSGARSGSGTRGGFGSRKPQARSGSASAGAGYDTRPQKPMPPDDVCWGRGPVLDLVKASPDRCTRLLIANNVRPPYLDELVDAARAGRVVYQLVAPEALDRLCPGERHQGVACRLTEVKPVELETFLKNLDRTKPALLVVLDHIEDPHNVGAIVRSAECGGASAVIYSKRREALPGGTVVKTSAGASLRLPMIAVVNITRTIEQLQAADFWVAGLEGNAETNIWTDKLPSRLAIVIGAEGEGLSRLVSESCDQLLRIPITGGVGSLNASVAAALGIFEWRRQLTSTDV